MEDGPSHQTDGRRKGARAEAEATSGDRSGRRSVEEDMGGLGFLEEAAGLVPAGLCSLATQGVAGYNIHRHLSNYTEPRIQRYMIRIILMVPLYSMSSFFSLAFPSTAFYLTTIRSCYEAYGKRTGQMWDAQHECLCLVPDSFSFLPTMTWMCLKCSTTSCRCASIMLEDPTTL